ncbi:response regulator transcription factor [Sulfobacillus harzensis]|uniref:Stage 0 sporulation protein A homolog n=1 Tax=Sulfobacillus harzensis TaxID=2729629 RepID=A0A7Y0Q2G9_9FIRM|nr:response regulator transcription factor [Sulfobacillus harzensis]NMP23178.1 response regulator transcription factor [Sulfobacillus harzensis]
MPSALLIEDDPRIARLLILELGRHDWIILWQRTGRDGLKAMESRSVDIVLLDLMLPDMDGMQVCQHIRQTADVPLLMLTARDAVIDRVQGLDAGADDYLVKPFAMSELLARMRALIRRLRTAPEVKDDWLSVGNLRVSERRHEVRVLDQPVELTAREFALLQYLLQNVGVVVTRDMILERVWGWGYRGSSAVVDVYMGYLRHKIDWTRAEVVLATIRGVGYLVRDIE